MRSDANVSPSPPARARHRRLPWHRDRGAVQHDHNRRDRGAGRVEGVQMTSLIRQTFKTSRLSEFCSENELVNQTGHAVEDWPLVILKELFDNALDGCEEAGTAPVI